jgi:hypothetical protein
VSYSFDLTLPTITNRGLLDLPDGHRPAAEVPSGAEHWYRYAVAYKEAADRLSSSMSDTFGRNLLGAPMLFLYRHYVELHLKSLLLDAGELLDDPQAVPPKHYLLQLWERVRSLLLRVGPGSNGGWLDRADEVIAQLAALDPTSLAFRYPVDNGGKPSLPSVLFADPAVVTGVIAELYTALNIASTQIDVYQGLKYEGL